jgi:hypothetical protein
MVRYSIGKGRFSADGKYINIQTQMYTLDGEPDGHHEGVDEPIFNSVFDTFNRPDPPQPPFDSPEGPVEHVGILSHAKGIWTFGDGSTITAYGPANLHTVIYSDDATQFWVTGNQIITGGTGRFAGARGLKTVGGSTWVPKGIPLTGTGEFSSKTVEVFRVVRRGSVKS